MRRRPLAWADADEASVVALAITGDAAAFGELVRRRQRWLRMLLRRLCRDATLADDLAQQTLLQAWRTIGGLRASGAFASWLRTMALHVWLQHLRAGTTTIDALSVVEEDLPAPPSSPTVRLDLDAALATLAPAVRLCIVLAYHEGMSHGEIAVATGLPVGTVKSHLTRGSARLRERLKDYRE